MKLADYLTMRECKTREEAQAVWCEIFSETDDCEHWHEDGSQHWGLGNARHGKCDCMLGKSHCDGCQRIFPNDVLHMWCSADADTGLNPRHHLDCIECLRELFPNLNFPNLKKETT